jgi:hypothetical protein
MARSGHFRTPTADQFVEMYDGEVVGTATIAAGSPDEQPPLLARPSGGAGTARLELASRTPQLLRLGLCR